MSKVPFKVGDRVRIARDSAESDFIRTGATGVVEVGPWQGMYSMMVVVRVDNKADILRITAYGRFAVAVPVAALEKIDGLFDI